MPINMNTGWEEPLNYEDLAALSQSLNQYTPTNSWTTSSWTDCSGHLDINYNALRELVYSIVKELLEKEGYILGKTPDEPDDVAFVRIARGDTDGD